VSEAWRSSSSWRLAFPTIDASEIRAAERESRILGAKAHSARPGVAERVAVGQDPGCTLGPKPPVRRHPGGRDDDPILRGQSAITPELTRCLQHRLVLGELISSTYVAAAESFECPPALMAAAQGHLSVLRSRQAIGEEGGAELDRAVPVSNACASSSKRVARPASR
jgi:hypothetical protein